MTKPENQSELFEDPFLSDIPVIEGYKLLDRCVLYSKLGQGGMGAVYRGRHLNLDIDVAVKCLKPGLDDGSGEFVVRFQREARVAAAINNENLVRVFDVAETSGVHYLIMEFIAGENVRERVGRKGPLEVEEAVTVALGAARGLAAAHQNGVVHRDIKPDNIMISKAGEVKIADLGLARAAETLDSLKTATGMVMGTPRYMPPEQFEDVQSVGPQADVWAMGAVLFFMLTGRDGISAMSFPQIMHQVCFVGFPSLSKEHPNTPADLCAIVERCTRPDLNDRYAGGAELAHALESFLVPLSQPTMLADDAAGSLAMPTLVSPPPPQTMAKIKLSAVEDSEKNGGTNSDRSSKHASSRDPKTQPSNFVLGLIAVLVVLASVGMYTWQKEIPPFHEGGLFRGAVQKIPVWATVTSDVDFDEESGFPRKVTDKATGIELVLIPAGEFWRGASPGDSDAEKDEKPRHRVRITKPFYLGKYEVTNEQYRFHRPSHNPRDYRELSLKGDQQPAVRISWREAEEFCARYGFKLPTEAQWEYAARAGTESRFIWGDSASDLKGNANLLGPANKDRLEHSWDTFERVGGSFVTPSVGEFHPNQYGLYDMIGGVMEWCSDFYGDREYANVEQGARDPKGSGTGPFRVLRGGSWVSLPRDCRVSQRGQATPTLQRHFVGFRVSRAP